MKKIVFICSILLFIAAAGAFFLAKQKRDVQFAPIGPAAVSFDLADDFVEENDEPSAESEEKEEEIVPAFDVVRIENDGSAVIAGRAKPFDSPVLMDGNEPVAALNADENGEWVYLPAAPFTAGDHEFWLKSDVAPQKEQANVVYVNIPEITREALIVMVSPDEDAQVFQKPHDADEETGKLEISLARYKDGTLIVKGKTQAAGRVLVYLGNELIDSAENKENNEFELRCEIGLDADRAYLLRADETDADSRVYARAEVPFSVKKGADPSVRIIRGDNLWTIARHVYGSGFDYTIIYKANKNQIKNPDLIYPEQVFVLPKKAKSRPNAGEIEKTL